MGAAIVLVSKPDSAYMGQATFFYLLSVSVTGFSMLL